MAADGLVDISMIEVDGLIADFNRLKFGVQKKIVRNAMDSAIQPIAARARQLVPVDSGALKASIATRVIGSRGKILGQVYCGDEMFKGDEYYAGMIEYGHMVGKRPSGIGRNAKKLASLRKAQRSVHSTELQAQTAARAEAQIMRLNETRTRFVPAQPFLRPALAEKRDEAVEIFSESVTSQVRDYLNRKGTRHLRTTIGTVATSFKGRMAKAAKGAAKRSKAWKKSGKKLAKAWKSKTNALVKSLSGPGAKRRIAKTYKVRGSGGGLTGRFRSGRRPGSNFGGPQPL
jgi:HK97 gp10 family phage protein